MLGSVLIFFFYMGLSSFPTITDWTDCLFSVICSCLLCHRFNSVQFSHSVLSDSLRPHGLQHTRLPCPSTTPRAYSNSCPLSQWCHPTMSLSVSPLSSYLQSLPASGSLPMGQSFSSGGQSVWASASASLPLMNTQGWFPLRLTGFISLL